MKKIRVLFALLLVIALAFGMAACGGDAKKLVGEWRCTLDCTKLLEGELGLTGGADEQAFLDYVDFGKFEMKFILNFGDDGSYSFEVDKDAFDTYMSKLQVELGGAIRTYMTDMFTESAGDAGTTLAALMDYYNVDSIDGLVEVSTGLTIESLLEQSFSQIDSDKLFAQAGTEGTYAIKGGKLHLTSGDTTGTVTYTLDGDNLTITADKDELEANPEMFETIKDLMPFVFVRQ